MKTKNVFKQLQLLFILIIIGGCNDMEPEPLRFYDVTYEVPVHGVRYIGIKKGSGDYSLQIENPYLFSASVDKGWSNPEGMLLVRGFLTGESTLLVTDNRTGETTSLVIKVINNYEVLRVNQFYRNDSMYVEHEHPVLSKTPFVFLINNQARDMYFADLKEQKTITGNDLRIQGKGNYSFTMEDGNPYLTLIYPADENGQLTNDASVVATPRKFLISKSSEFLRHRLNENLNLGWQTIAKAYPDSLRGQVVIMEEVNSIYKFEGKFENVEIPTDVLNQD